MSEPNIPGGSIIVARKIVESEIWKKPPLYLKVWMYLLVRAQHKPYKNLRRGQLRTSIPEIIEACSHYVGARIERPTKDQIYNIIEWLRKPDEGGHESNAKATMISTTKATQGYLVTIDNYDFYQTLSNYESNDNFSDENSTEGTRKQQQDDNINKNVKNVKNDNEKHYTTFPSGEPFLNIYNSLFKKKFGKDHMKVTEEQLAHIRRNIEELISYDIDIETFAEQVEEHFINLPESNNGNILAFIPAFMRHFEVQSVEQRERWL